MLDNLNAVSIILWIGVSWIITLVGFYINSRNQEKNREFEFKKEYYFSMQNKLEIVFEWLSFYNSTVNMMIYCLERNTFLEEVFQTERIEERKTKNYSIANDLIYIYFHDNHHDFQDYMEIYEEVVDDYMNNTFPNKEPSEDVRNKILEKAYKAQNQIMKYMNSLKKEVNKHKIWKQ